MFAKIDARRTGVDMTVNAWTLTQTPLWTEGNVRANMLDNASKSED